MKPDQLLQNALLDALGVLEPEEAEAFERAFLEADPAVRAQVRIEQTRLIDLGELLPDVKPPASLRARVIGAVRTEVKAAAGEDESLVIPELDTSIATGVSAGIAGFIGPATQSRSMRVWRAAAIALGAATIGLGASTLFMTSEFASIQDRTLANADVDTTLSLGAGFASLMFSPDSTLAAFTPAQGAGNAEAMIAYDRTTGKGRLVWRGLEGDSSRPYAVVELDDDGQPGRIITTFIPRYGMQSTDIDLELPLPTRLAIVRTGADTQPVLLTLDLA